MEIILIIFIAILIITFVATYPIPTLTITVILIIIGLVIHQNNKDKLETLKEEQLRKKEKALETYDKIKKDIKIPNDALVVTYNKGSAKLLETKNYLWQYDDNLYFFPSTPPESDDPTCWGKVVLFKISVDKIIHYATKGEIIHENKISGGGGGGSSVGGAIVGGVIAGGAGAVIGSRKETDSITSELITHDNRKTFLDFHDDNNKKCTMFFNFEDYNIFYELLPEKSFDIVSEMKRNKIIDKLASKNITTDVTSQIKELAKLRDEGLITEDEFTQKKKLLLDKII